jgi:hypothetical protein
MLISMMRHWQRLPSCATREAAVVLLGVQQQLMSQHLTTCQDQSHQMTRVLLQACSRTAMPAAAAATLTLMTLTLMATTAQQGLPYRQRSGRDGSSRARVCSQLRQQPNTHLRRRVRLSALQHSGAPGWRSC